MAKAKETSVNVLSTAQDKMERMAQDKMEDADEPKVGLAEVQADHIFDKDTHGLDAHAEEPNSQNSSTLLSTCKDNDPAAVQLVVQHVMLESAGSFSSNLSSI